jgi:hypothetical protein
MQATKELKEVPSRPTSNGYQRIIQIDKQSQGRGKQEVTTN